MGSLGSQYKVVIQVDAPQQKLLANLVHHFISVDWHGGIGPKSTPRGACHDTICRGIIDRGEERPQGLLGLLLVFESIDFDAVMVETGLEKSIQV